ncbi:hypothetical protein Rhal01_03244 [Rubritalea halochordaticola]|uniref:Ice-binding protein C-terminal domain-containing protein n=2 Tax=Rubritalea halochordaticola TaxID=714537 RepID=A0ABP9V324_9BACT
MLLTVGSLLAASAMHVSAAVIVQDDFSGDSSTSLNGAAADTGGNWTSSDLFKTDGSFTTGSNLDRSAYVSLPSSLEANQVYTLEVTLDAQANSFFYVGLQGAELATTEDRVQNKYAGSLLLEFDAIGTAESKLHLYDGSNEVRPFTGTYNTSLSMIISTGSDLTNASVEFLIDGVSQGTISHDVTGLNTLVMGIEATSGTSSVDIGSVNFVAVPEPSSTALIGLAGIGFILRRRR